MSLFDKSITDEKDYLKIFRDEHTIVTADDSSPPAETQLPADPDSPFGYVGFRTITHNLGVVPMVRAFWDPYHTNTWYNARIWGHGEGLFGVITDPWLKIHVTTTQLKLWMYTEDVSQKYYVPVFYRIYKTSNQAVSTNDRIDKIFLKDSISESVAAESDHLTPGSSVVVIPHGQTDEVPIWTLQFSLNQDDWYPEGSEIIGTPYLDSGPPGGPYSYFRKVRVAAKCDAEFFYIYFDNHYDTSKTIYVRYALDKRA